MKYVSFKNVFRPLTWISVPRTLERTSMPFVWLRDLHATTANTPSPLTTKHPAPQYQQKRETKSGLAFLYDTNILLVARKEKDTLVFLPCLFHILPHTQTLDGYDTTFDTSLFPDIKRATDCEGEMLYPEILDRRIPVKTNLARKDASRQVEDDIDMICDLGAQLNHPPFTFPTHPHPRDVLPCYLSQDPSLTFHPDFQSDLTRLAQILAHTIQCFPFALGVKGSEITQEGFLTTPTLYQKKPYIWEEKGKGEIWDKVERAMLILFARHHRHPVLDRSAYLDSNIISSDLSAHDMLANLAWLEDLS